MLVELAELSITRAGLMLRYQLLVYRLYVPRKTRLLSLCEFHLLLVQFSLPMAEMQTFQHRLLSRKDVPLDTV